MEDSRNIHEFRRDGLPGEAPRHWRKWLNRRYLVESTQEREDRRDGP